jgi:hypothetical protein
MDHPNLAKTCVIPSNLGRFPVLALLDRAGPFLLFFKCPWSSVSWRLLCLKFRPLLDALFDCTRSLVVESALLPGRRSPNKLHLRPRVLPLRIHPPPYSPALTFDSRDRVRCVIVRDFRSMLTYPKPWQFRRGDIPRPTRNRRRSTTTPGHRMRTSRNIPMYANTTTILISAMRRRSPTVDLTRLPRPTRPWVAARAALEPTSGFASLSE